MSQFNHIINASKKNVTSCFDYITMSQFNHTAEFTTMIYGRNSSPPL